MAFQVTLSHMIVFFLVFAVGFAASRLKVIKEDALPAFAQIITKLLLPCMIFYSTYANCKRETIIGNWEMVLLAALFYAVISLLMFVIAKLMCIEHDKDRVFQLCFIFGNTGFVGVPLLAAVFPEQMVLALAIIMALPVMTVVPMVVANNGKEYEYATDITVVTLVASIVTIPLVVFLVGL